MIPKYTKRKATEIVCPPNHGYFESQNLEIFFFGDNEYVMVNCHCQLDWVWGHLGDIPQGMSVMVFSEIFHGECGWHHCMDCG